MTNILLLVKQSPDLCLILIVPESIVTEEHKRLLSNWTKIEDKQEKQRAVTLINEWSSYIIFSGQIKDYFQFHLLLP